MTLANMNAKPASIRRSLTVSLTKAAVLMAALLAFALPAHFFGDMFEVTPLATDDEVMSIRPHAEGSPAGLAERHGCWTGEAPEGVTVPGHVIVTELGKAPRRAGAAMVAKALEQIFEGVDHGIRVHAFCR